MSSFTNHLPGESWANKDVTITQVLSRLRELHIGTRSIYLEADDLIKTLDGLFDRKTFRHEPQMEKCVTHNWESRLHSALKTKWLLQIYRPNIMEKGRTTQKDIYGDVLRWLDEYIECMAGYLFQEKINYSKIEKYIGTNKFEPFVIQYLPLEDIHSLEPENLQRLNNSLIQTIGNADLLRKTLM